MLKYVAILIAVILIGLMLWALISQLFGYALLALAGVGLVVVVAGVILWRTKKASEPSAAVSPKTENRRDRAAKKDLKEMERRIRR